MKAKTIISTLVSVLVIGAALFIALRSFGVLPPGGAEAGAGAAAESPEAARSGQTDAGSGSGAGSPGTGRAEAQAEPARVRVVRAERGSLVGTVQLNGEIEAANRIMVYPDVAGTVDSVEATEGRYVGVDEPLLYVDPSKPGSEFQASPVRSPIAGTVVSVDVERGQEVQPSLPLVTVASLDRMRVNVEVPERYASAVVPGMEATFTSFAVADGEFSGSVVSVDPTIDPSSRSKSVELRIVDRAGKLEPGMFVRVSLPLDRAEDVVLLPFRAVVQEGGEEYVYVVEDETARRTPVSTGIIAQDRVEIRSGIEPGQTVVTEGHQELRPGRPVMTETAEPGADARQQSDKQRVSEGAGE